jgi:RNA polymerase sigma-70 factor (ECF subfamily)
LTSLEDAVLRVSRGDSSAFEEVVDATSAQLVRLSARMLGSVADAEDVVQEAYVKAFRSLVAGEFDQRSRVETWLYRIVVNATIDAKRKRARTAQPTASDELADPGWDGAAFADARLSMKELAGWLGELPPDQQAVLVLKAIEGRSSAEVAEIMGCSEGAVEQRLVRARAALRQRRDES